ncbi:MAG: hypothetical protein LW832_00880 [Parachlamydia sp.]|jgi:hypothetical protein|nr:hypothetical protein [Parachlamydia sp.]
MALLQKIQGDEQIVVNEIGRLLAPMLRLGRLWSTLARLYTFSSTHAEPQFAQLYFKKAMRCFNFCIVTFPAHLQNSTYPGYAAKMTAELYDFKIINSRDEEKTQKYKKYRWQAVKRAYDILEKNPGLQKNSEFVEEIKGTYKEIESILSTNRTRSLSLSQPLYRSDSRTSPRISPRSTHSQPGSPLVKIQVGESTK